MAKKNVICPYCNVTFDANSEEYVMIGRRYAHKRCYEHRDPEIEAKDDFYQYIKEIYGPKYDYQKIERQRLNFVKKNEYTTRGILNALKYWFDVKGNDTSKTNGGIGIVPYIYEEAQEYMAFISSQQKKKIVPVAELESFTIKKVVKGRKKKQFLDFDEE
jgi:hypothetical protein